MKASTISNSTVPFECIEEFNTKGMGLNRPILKSIAHRDGIPHQTVHLWVICKEGIILQQRSSSKKTFPRYWDVSVAGHVHYKEAIESALERETLEEIGLAIKAKDCVFIGTFKETHIHPRVKIVDCEFHHCFIYKTSTSIVEFSRQLDEVSALKAVSLEELIVSTNTLVPHHTRYYKAVITALSQT